MRTNLKNQHYNYCDELMYLLLVVSVDELMELKKEIFDPPSTLPDDIEFPF